MAEYDDTGSFEGIFFKIGNITSSQKPSTLKTNLGKTFIEKLIPSRNTVDIVLEVEGVINGLSQVEGESQSTAIERDRIALEALEDGYKHAYHDGKHGTAASTLNFVIAPESLKFDDSANRSHGEPYKFTMRLIQWQ